MDPRDAPFDVRLKPHSRLVQLLRNVTNFNRAGQRHPAPSVARFDHLVVPDIPAPLRPEHFRLTGTRLKKRVPYLPQDHSGRTCAKLPACGSVLLTCTCVHFSPGEHSLEHVATTNFTAPILEDCIAHGTGLISALNSTLSTSCLCNESCPVVFTGSG
jgi:hypothetical protein